MRRLGETASDVSSLGDLSPCQIGSRPCLPQDAECVECSGVSGLQPPPGRLRVQEVERLTAALWRVANQTNRRRLGADVKPPWGALCQSGPGRLECCRTGRVGAHGFRLGFVRLPAYHRQLFPRKENPMFKTLGPRVGPPWKRAVPSGPLSNIHSCATVEALRSQCLSARTHLRRRSIVRMGKASSSAVTITAAGPSQNQRATGACHTTHAKACSHVRKTTRSDSFFWSGSRPCFFCLITRVFAQAWEGWQQSWHVVYVVLLLSFGTCETYAWLDTS